MDSKQFVRMKKAFTTIVRQQETGPCVEAPAKLAPYLSSDLFGTTSYVIMTGEILPIA